MVADLQRARKPLQLNIKISLAILCVVVGSFVILYWNVLLHAEDYISDRLDNELTHDLNRIAEQLNRQDDEVNKLIRFIATEPKLQQSLVSRSSHGINQTLNRLISIYPSFAYIFLIDNYQEVFAVSTRNGEAKKIPSERILGINLADVKLQHNLRNVVSQSHIMDEPFATLLNIQSELVQLYFSPVKKSKEVIGWLGISFRWQRQTQDVLDQLLQGMLETDQFVTEISVANNQNPMVLSRSPFAENNINHRIHKRLPYKIMGENFYLTVTADSFQSMQVVRETSRGMLIFITISGLLSGLLLYAWLSRLLLQRLTLIHRGVDQIKSGELEKVVPTLGKDEIGLLAEGINDMRKSLLDLRTNLEVKVKNSTQELRDNQARLELVNKYLIGETQRIEDAVMRMSLATEAGSIGVWDLDIKSRVLNWDERMFQLYGVSREDFSGAYEAWEQGLYGEDLDATKASLEQAIATTQPFDTEFRVQWPNGQIRYIKANAKFTYDDRGKPIRMVGTNYDVTKLKEQERALLLEKEKTEDALSRIEAVFSTTPDSIVAIDAVGQIESVNQSATEIFGYSKDEMLGKNVKFLMPQPYAEEHDAYIERYHHLGEKRVIGKRRVLQAQKKDGTCFPVELIINEGKIKDRIFFTGLIRDISEKLRIEQNLQQQEALLRSAIQGSSAGFAIEDSQGRFIEVNDALCEWLGYSQDELLQMSSIDGLVAEAQADYKSIADKLFNGELERVRKELRYVRKDGSPVWGLLSAAPVKNQYNQVVFMVAHIVDIEQEKILTETLNARNQALEKSNADLDQFAYIASHDLKSPLNAIKQLSIWIAEDCEELLPEESQKHLTLLQSRVRRMEKLLEDLLLYSRVGRYDYTGEIINLKEMIHAIWDLLAPSENFHLDISVDSELLDLPRIPLEIALRNLISNSLKHHDQASGNIYIQHQNQENANIIIVTDDGPGIPPELHHKALEMFQTLKSRDQVEGSGMGLALVKKIAIHLGGVVIIESDGSRGTSIKIVCPKD